VREVCGVDVDPVVLENTDVSEARVIEDNRIPFEDGRFDCVVANLLRSEMLPIADPIAGAVAPGGLLVLSGLLEADGPLVIAAFAERGLHFAAERDALDPNGDRWIAPLLVRRP